MTTEQPSRDAGGRHARGHNVVPSVQKLARQNSVKALERLIELIGSDSHHVAVEAAKSVLDRGEGRVPQRPRQNRARKAKPQELRVKIQSFKGNGNAT